MPRLILASTSPRRAELLRQIGVDFVQRPIEVDESPRPGEVAAETVLRLALAKARAGWAEAGPDAAVLGADTLVSIEGEALGKPRDEAEHRAMLRRLSGRRHEVHSAVALAWEDEARALLSVSHVHFRPLQEEEIAAYWASGETADKAGGYAIQGRAAIFVSHLQGSFSGVMGLPLYETAQLLAEAGIGPWRAA